VLSDTTAAVCIGLWNTWGTTRWHLSALLLAACPTEPQLTAATCSGLPVTYSLLAAKNLDTLRAFNPHLESLMSELNPA
jgi:hypothetical protein